MRKIYVFRPLRSLRYMSRALNILRSFLEDAARSFTMKLRLQKLLFLFFQLPRGWKLFFHICFSPDEDEEAQSSCGRGVKNENSRSTREKKFSRLEKD
jgi:hypothetical protein